MKKLLFVVLAAMLAVMTACSSGGGNEASGEPGSASPQGSASAEASAPASDSQEPVTITIVNKDFPADDPNTQKLVKGIEEGMKAQGKPVKLEIVPVQSGTYSEKLGLLLQTGNIPDLIYFQGGDYAFAVTQQILEDLTPYIEKSTYLKDSLTPFNQERMKNYPYLVWPSPTSTKVPVVRKDWFDQTESGKALLADPTIDNYYAFFKELKDKTGVKYVYTVPGALAELDTTFMQAFGLSTTWIKGDDGRYAFAGTTPFEKEKLDFYAKLYQEGLLDPEFLTKKWDTKEKAFYDGEAAVIAGTQGQVINIYNTKMIGQNGEGTAVMPLPPAKGKGQGFTPIDVSKEDRGFAISKLSENKELAFAILDFLASPAGLMLDQLGVEGEEYEVVDNKIKLTDKYEAWYPHFVANTINFKPDKEFDPSTPFLTEPAAESLDLVAKLATNDNTFMIPADLAGQWDASLALFQEYEVNVVTGKASTADFDKFVKDWLASGGQAVTEYANQTIK